jgi:hypothetical protein
LPQNFISCPELSVNHRLLPNFEVNKRSRNFAKAMTMLALAI